MDEVERIEAIDKLADWKLNRPGEERPATDVWDESAQEIDAREGAKLATAMVADKLRRSGFPVRRSDGY